ncbi:HEAT repeat domain-containing protein [Candidatus Leptofilum sp.]|uniref:HEAT repeat domain-containing protein n=1 Tax=Candidatus Leptofilum sp. TaxID=3241576 RepID=UPI003B5AE2DC
MVASDSLKLLSRLLKERKQSGQAPYVLVLGSGEQLSNKQKVEISNDLFGYESFTQLDEYYGKISEIERYISLRPYLESQTPSAGYHYLADLLYQGYFDTVLDCQIDRNLEDALLETKIRSAEYQILINRKDDPNRILESIKSSFPRIKIIKVYGDFTTRRFAFSELEVIEYCDNLREVLDECLAGHILVANLSNRDRDLFRLLPRTGGTIWYAQDSALAESHPVTTHIKIRKPVLISGEGEQFDGLFSILHNQLLGKSIEAFWKMLGMRLTPEGTQVAQFENLPQLFVEPKEYEEIMRNLAEEHFAIVTGEPHLGKTYTAFYILWKFFGHGYRPNYLPIDELISPSGRSYISYHSLLRKYIKNGHVIYLDDPFGKTQFIPNEDLVSNLHNLIIEAKRYDVRILITSRVNILKQALGYPYPTYVKPLIMSLSSYEQEQRRKMIVNYADLYKPNWSKATDYYNLVNEVSSVLIAPHNIDLFVRGTVQDENVNNAISRAQDFNDLSVELARTIANRRVHEILFYLTISVLSSRFISLKECKRLYYAMWNSVKKQGASDAQIFLPWEKCVDNFSDELMKRVNWDGEENISFYHPVYDEAVTLLLQNNLLVINLLSLTVESLAKDNNPFAREAAARIICRYFSVEHTDLILALSNDPDRDVRSAIATNLWLALDKIPKELINKLSTDPSEISRKMMGKSIIEYWEKLPSQLRHESISFLIKDHVDWVKVNCIQAFVSNYKPAFEQYLLRMVESENEFIRIVIANELMTHYQHNFLEILQKLITTREDRAKKFIHENAYKVDNLRVSDLYN